MFLLIDIGNTRSKIAIANADGIIHREHRKEPWSAVLQRLQAQYDIDRTIVSCVGDDGETLKAALAEHSAKTCNSAGLVWLGHTTPCAIADVPCGYGADRLAADIGAYSGQHALLVVDVGTCITYDLVINGRLTGGAITPGPQLRLNAMHDYTAALPLVNVHDETGAPPVLGSTTESCMRSAATHAVAFEIEGYCTQIRTEHPDLDIVLTGGYSISLPAYLHARQAPDLVMEGLLKLALQIC